MIKITDQECYQHHKDTLENYEATKHLAVFNITENRSNDIQEALLKYRRANNIFEVGDLVVRKNKKSKPLIWKVVGYSNVLKDSAICDNENELLNHFSFKDIRHTTPEEIKAGRRL